MPTSAGPRDTDRAALDAAARRKGFIAIAISFVVMVFSMSMVFVALSAIADDFHITLRAVSWVVIVQSLVLSGLMLPMGRVADMIGRKKVHLVGLALFAVGSLGVALAPTFPLMLAARVVMSIGNAMGQAVGTAMLVAMFPPEERGKALGSQTSIVAIGAAMGPIGGGFVLQVLPWQAMFFLLVPPLVVAYVMGHRYLDEAVVSGHGAGTTNTNVRPPFDWGGAILSSLVVIALVLTVSNPLALEWTSAPIFGGFAAMAVFFALFIRWELRHRAPMLELRLFAHRAFSKAVASRTLGFTGYTAVTFLVPIFLISVRGLSEGTAGAVLFLSSLGMGVAADVAGRQTDRFGERPIFLAGFAANAVTLAGLALLGQRTPLWIVMVLLLCNGLSFGLWNVPNNSAVLASAPPENLGVVGAFLNLTRNIGNVFGQAVASAIVVGVMTTRGLDIPLREIASTAGAADAFLHGSRLSFLVATVFAALALLLAWTTRPPRPVRPGAAEKT